METVGSSAGFEIVRDGDLVWLVHRRTRGPLLVFVIAGPLALVLAGLGAILAVQAFGRGDTHTGLTLAGIFGGVAAALTLMTVLGVRAFRRRRAAPIADVSPLRANLTSGRLERGTGADVADLAQVAIDTPRNLGDSTQGSMRWVRLRWPGGKAMIFTAASREAERVAGYLRQLGFAGG